MRCRPPSPLVRYTWPRPNRTGNWAVGRESSDRNRNNRTPALARPVDSLRAGPPAPRPSWPRNTSEPQRWQSRCGFWTGNLPPPLHRVHPGTELRISYNRPEDFLRQFVYLAVTHHLLNEFLVIREFFPAIQHGHLLCPPLILQPIETAAFPIVGDKVQHIVVGLGRKFCCHLAAILPVAEPGIVIDFQHIRKDGGPQIFPGE